MSIQFINKGESKEKPIIPEGTRFQGSGFKKFDLTKYDTSQLTTMANLFNSCSSLVSMDLSEVDTTKITSMNAMFTSCISLTSVDLSNIKGNITITGIFSACPKLTTINWNNCNIITDGIGTMFNGCSSLTSIDLSHVSTNNPTQIRNMFKGCTNLVNVDISHFDCSNVKNGNYLQNMVTDCAKLSNDSMNSILKALSTITNITSNKTKQTLAYVGFTEEQAEICTTLSNWSLCEEAGWRTGY